MKSFRLALCRYDKISLSIQKNVFLVLQFQDILTKITSLGDVIFLRPPCAGAGKVRCGVRCAGAGAVYVRARFCPHQ